MLPRKGLDEFSTAEDKEGSISHHLPTPSPFFHENVERKAERNGPHETATIVMASPQKSLLNRNTETMAHSKSLFGDLVGEEMKKSSSQPLPSMSRQMSLEAIRSRQIRERSQQEQKRTEWPNRPESHSMPQEVCPLTSGTKGRKHDLWDLAYLEKKTEAPNVFDGNLSERKSSFSKGPNDKSQTTTMVSETYGLPETSLSSNDLDFLDDFFDVNSRVMGPSSSRIARRDSTLEAVSAPSSSCASPFAKAKSVANHDLDLLSDNVDVCNLAESVECSGRKGISKGFGVRGQHRRSFSDLNVPENCALPPEIFEGNFRRKTRESDLSNQSSHLKLNPNDPIDIKRKNSRTLAWIHSSDFQGLETSIDERRQKSMTTSHPVYGAASTNQPLEDMGIALDATHTSLSDLLSPPLPENTQGRGTTSTPIKSNYDLSMMRAQAEVNLNNKIRSAQNEALSRIYAMEEKRQREEKEKEIYAEGVNATLAAWRDKKEGNIRALLCSLTTILWAECEWNPVHLSQLITPKQVKIHYVKAISKVHPDKLRSDVRMDRRLLAQGVFFSLNEAWDAFRQQNPTP
jgi:hypothetical protein